MLLIYGKGIWLIGVYVFNCFADFVGLYNHNALRKMSENLESWNLYCLIG
jgi:hypothetical protein